MTDDHRHGHVARRETGTVGREAEAVGSRPQRQRDGNLALGTGAAEQPVELLVVVAIETKARTQTVGHTLREQAIPLYPIHAEALQLAVGIEEAQAVAVGEAGRPRYRESVAPQFLDRPHELTHRLRCVEGSDVGTTATGEIVCIASIERFL